MFHALWPLAVLLLSAGVATAQEKPAKPATLAEVLQAVDWSTFPRPEGATWVETDLFHTAYFAPGKIGAVDDFLRKAFTAAGWSEVKRPAPEEKPDEMRSISFSKGGMVVEGYLEAKTNTTQVSMRSHGNPNAAVLPRPADAKVTYAFGHYVQYTTAAAPEAAAAYCQKAFPEQGWRFTPTVGAAASAKRGEHLLRFVQGAMSLDLRVIKHASGGAEVYCYSGLRREFDPAEVAATLDASPSSAPLTRAAALQLIDLRQFPRVVEKKPLINTGLNLQYEAIGVSLDRVAAFYRQKLNEAGWKQLIQTAENADRVHHRFEKNGSVLSVKLRQEHRPQSFVRVQVENHGNVDLRRLPFPPGAEITPERHVQPVMVRTTLSPEDLTAFYRKELGKLGWTQKGTETVFVQNDMNIVLYIGTPGDGTTPVQVGATFRGE